MKREYYVYEWIRLDTNEPFYIGKGKGDRWRRLKRDGNIHFNRIVSKIPVAVNILEDNLDEATAFEYEIFYINEYREYGYNLVNITDGGEGAYNPNRNYWGKNNPNYGNGEKITGVKNPFYGKRHSESTIKILKEKAKLRPPVSDETRKKISKALKGEKNPFFNVKGKDNHFSIKIICLDDNKVFDSMNECCECYGLQSSAVSRVCSGEYYHTKGLHFMYYDEYLKCSEYDISKKINSSRVRAIYCITTNKIFESALEAGEYYNTDNSGILKACKGKKKFSGKLEDGSNLVWMYYDEYVKSENKHIELLKSYIHQGFVYCINNNKLYVSCKEAYKELNISEKKISEICRGKIDEFKGFRFVYYNDIKDKKSVV